MGLSEARGVLLSPLDFFPRLVNGRLVENFNEFPAGGGIGVCRNLFAMRLCRVQRPASFMEEHSKLQSIIQTLEHSDFYISIIPS